MVGLMMIWWHGGGDEAQCSVVARDSCCGGASPRSNVGHVTGDGGGQVQWCRKVIQVTGLVVIAKSWTLIIGEGGFCSARRWWLRELLHSLGGGAGGACIVFHLSDEAPTLHCHMNASMPVSGWADGRTLGTSACRQGGWTG